MASRTTLHEELEKILGNSNVYFQPPVSIEMQYPAIVYELQNIDNQFADNNVYIQNKSYKVTVIDKDPDSEIVERVSKMPMCEFDTFFVSDRLNHTVFTITY